MSRWEDNDSNAGTQSKQGHMSDRLKTWRAKNRIGAEGRRIQSTGGERAEGKEANRISTLCDQKTQGGRVKKPRDETSRDQL